MLQIKKAFSGISTNNLQASKDFYINQLGLKILNETMGLEIVLPGGGQLFIYEKPDHQPATFTVLNFVVEDIDSSVKQLKSDGVIFESYNEGVMKTDKSDIARGKTAGMGPDIAWFKDPAGNILSVIEN